MENVEYTKQNLQTLMREGREKLEQALGRLSEAQMQQDNAVYGTWQVKDLLAHLCWWEQRVGFILDELLSGRPDPAYDTLNFDERNALVFKANHDRPLADVRAEEQQAYQKLVALVERASHDDMFNPQRFTWTKGQPFFEWIAGNSYGHYEEHLPAILELI
jgi:hypothetical protein